MHPSVARERQSSCLAMVLIFIGIFVFVGTYLAMTSNHDGVYPSYRDLRGVFEDSSGSEDSAMGFDELVGYQIEETDSNSIQTTYLASGYSVYKLLHDAYRLHPDDVNKRAEARFYLFARKGEEIVYYTEVERYSSRSGGHYNSKRKIIERRILPGYDSLRAATYFKDVWLEPEIVPFVQPERLVVFDSGQYAPHVMPPFARDGLIRQLYNSVTGLYDE